MPNSIPGEPSRETVCEGSLVRVLFYYLKRKNVGGVGCFLRLELFFFYLAEEKGRKRCEVQHTYRGTVCLQGHALDRFC